jgi:predicted CopG family antitoxin
VSKTLTISDETYEKLETLARFRAKENVEQLLDELEDADFIEWQKELARRREVGNRIIKFQEKMREKYGVMQDSMEILREDRMRG